MRFLLRLTGAVLLGAGPAALQAPRVELGVDVLLGSPEAPELALVRGKRVGLVTNPSGVDRALVPTVDRLAADERVDLVQLFGPEHGIRGDAYAGDDVGDERDPVTGLPVESLYGARKAPSAEALERVDVLLFDIQDIGSRTYTYISTLGETMLAAAAAKKPLVVLDRPNPLGGELVEGPLREERWKSFIGWGPLPLVHGLTIGEIARLYAGELGIDCELHVVRMRGWRRDMIWEDTGLTWVQTSPHIPHALHAHLYVVTGMIGGVTTNVNEGVGYTLPFETWAAQFVEPRRLAATLQAAPLAGVRFTPIAYSPFYGRHEGLALRGVRIHLDDPRALRPVRTALAGMVALERLWPGEVEYQAGRPFAIHWGSETVLEKLRAGAGVAEIEATWAAELAAFRERRERYLLY